MTPSRTPMVAGNWKMHKTVAEAQTLAREIRRGLPTPLTVDVVLAPPYTALTAVAREIQGSAIALAAQDVFWEAQGAFTGAISPLMLKDAGCRLVIIGHSERRQYFGETDESVNKKVKAALQAGLMPIVCIGETLAQREAQETLTVIASQLNHGLLGLGPAEVGRLVIAYEPVWAIGTGRTATPAQAQEVHQFIRRWLHDQAGSTVAEGLRILYGGSVTPDNIRDLINAPDIDGALVGGASLKAEAFLKIIALGA
ncbi:MAG: triose-phosphate isomerase [Desulfobacca sp.]|uniref:triose-phosphate isomerase n=1 Tax=Desulfobacca sp. TaxID=2067990 RepID=UPI0040490C3F